MMRMLATVVSVDENNHPVILLDGAEEGDEVTALRAGSYIPREGDRCVVTKLGMRFVAEYAIDGEIGAGFSAYEIAVQHGFTGTEEEWLESLRGAPGTPGVPGANGLSAYQVAVANGFTGTEEEWLDSLRGADGVGVDPSANRLMPVVCEFLTRVTTSNAPLTGTTLGSGGTPYDGDGDANHIGIIEIAGPSTGTGGYRVSTAMNAMKIAGSERCELIFKAMSFNSLKLKFGFHNSEDRIDLLADAGVMLLIVGSTLSGRVISGETQYDTATTYIISTSTWYRATISINASATQAEFRMYAENGTLLWSDSVVCGIADGVPVGMNLNVTGGSTTRFLAVDRISFDIDRELAR